MSGRREDKQMMLTGAMMLFWAGFVCSISFMEAWLKFQAQGVTLPIGLSIGRMVFASMNRVEWVFLILLFVNTLWQIKHHQKWLWISFLVILPILLLQSHTLLPRMAARAVSIINGGHPQKSWLHLWYIAVETIKVTTLIVGGIMILKADKHKTINHD